MKKGTDMMIASGVLMCAVIATLFYSINQPTGYMSAAPADERTDAFVSCVYESGATLYLSDSCGPECEEQKALFGDSFGTVKIIFCEGACARSDVTKFPTWMIDGGKYEGVLSLDELGQLTGCKL